MIIAVDFDGTVVTHQYPEVGMDLAGCVKTLRRIAEKHQIILWTMRSGKHLEDAVKWFADRHVPLFGINTNPDQSEWTQSPKAYAQLYIDDAALGCPVNYMADGRAAADWKLIEDELIRRGIIL